MSNSSKQGLINYYKNNPIPKNNYKWIHKGEIYTRVRIDELKNYLNDGWVQEGHALSEEHKKAIGVKNKQNHTGRIHVHNETEHYMIKPNELKEYLDKGFIIGSGVSISQPSTIWMNKDGKNARVDPAEEQQYIDNGWTRGMLKGSKLKK